MQYEKQSSDIDEKDFSIIYRRFLTLFDTKYWLNFSLRLLEANKAFLWFCMHFSWNFGHLLASLKTSNAWKIIFESNLDNLSQYIDQVKRWELLFWAYSYDWKKIIFILGEFDINNIDFIVSHDILSIWTEEILFRIKKLFEIIINKDNKN